MTLRVSLYIAGVLALLVAVYWLAWSWDPFGRRERLERRAEAAEQQAELNAGATQAVEDVYRAETRSRNQAEEAISDVQASTEPADILAAHLSGIRRMRDASTQGDDPGS